MNEIKKNITIVTYVLFETITGGLQGCQKMHYCLYTNNGLLYEGTSYSELVLAFNVATADLLESQYKVTIHNRD